MSSLLRVSIILNQYKIAFFPPKTLMPSKFTFTDTYHQEIAKIKPCLKYLPQYTPKKTKRVRFGGNIYYDNPWTIKDVLEANASREIDLVTLQPVISTIHQARLFKFEMIIDLYESFTSHPLGKDPMLTSETHAQVLESLAKEKDIANYLL